MLQLLALPTSLCALLLATAAQSRPLIPLRRESVPSIYLQHVQQPLKALSEDDFGLPTHRTSIPPPRHVNAREQFDARENSVGVLFVPADEEAEVSHLWLPLGKRVYTRDSPSLPLHPATARITTLITTTPSAASAEQLDRVECDVWTSVGKVDRNAGYDAPKTSRVSFSRSDGLVHFAREEDEYFWLRGQEVESYECHS